MTWGGHGTGQLGRRASQNGPNAIPAAVERVKGIRAIAVGMGHVLCLTDSGTVVSWGNNAGGATGSGVDGPVPTLIPRLTQVQSIATSFNRSFAVLSDGQIMAWGSYLKPWARPSGAKDISPFPRPLEVEGLTG
jgi:alpha-tubulin suppressor-like RCC1 family protein